MLGGPPRSAQQLRFAPRPPEPPGVLGEISGGVADLGVMVPLAAALILTNGLDAGAVFVCAGLLVIGSGLYFRVPFPVQPLKAMAAVAVAQHLQPGVIHAAGLEIAAFLLVLSIGGVADRVAKVFTTPIVRALQIGVGLLLIGTAWRLITQPPEVFRGTPTSPCPVVLGAAALCLVWWSSRAKRYALAIVLIVAGGAFAWWTAAPVLQAPSVSLPSFAVPRSEDFATAFVLLVVPQLPLTFGNAVVAVTEVAHGSFGQRAARVTPARVCISCGAGNVVSALLGGMPMCHGAGGLTAHVRLGARTKWMNVGLGATFIALGAGFGDQVPLLLGLLPVWALAAFLGYAGIRHSLLASDLRGADLVAAAAAGAAGAWRGNLTVTIALVAAYAYAKRLSGGLLSDHPRYQTFADAPRAGTGPQ